MGWDERRAEIDRLILVRIADCPQVNFAQHLVAFHLMCLTALTRDFIEPGVLWNEFFRRFDGVPESSDFQHKPLDAQIRAVGLLFLAMTSVQKRTDRIEQWTEAMFLSHRIYGIPAVEVEHWVRMLDRHEDGDSSIVTTVEKHLIPMLHPLLGIPFDADADRRLGLLWVSGLWTQWLASIFKNMQAIQSRPDWNRMYSDTIARASRASNQPVGCVVLVIGLAAGVAIEFFW